MLFLLFQVGKDRYALEAGHVVEVVPMLALKHLPQSPKGVVGLFNYRGQPVPAVDLCQLTIGTPAGERLSTRIIIVNHGPRNQRQRLLGLIAEKATEMLRKSPQDFVQTGVNFLAAPYLGPVLMDGQGPIQWIDEQRLLPEHVCHSLFAQTLEFSTAYSGNMANR